MSKTAVTAVRRLWQSRYGPLLVALAVLLVVAVVRLKDYGASLDEYHNTYYGRLFLDTYKIGRLFRPPEIGYFNGPFYFMVFTVTANLLHDLHPAWLFTDGIHLTNFVTFLVGVIFFYRIALRLFSRTPALFVTALFVSQPVLFGHAFINQKDSPLMAFFLASVELGLTAVDRWAPGAPGAAAPRGMPTEWSPAAQWRRLSFPTRIIIVAGGLVGLALLFDLWLTLGIHQAARGLLTQLYDGRGPALLVGAFRVVAQDAYKTPLDAYLAKLNGFMSWARIVLTPGIVAGLFLLWRFAFPASFSNSAGRWSRKWAFVLIAGGVLGLTTSIRLLGPFAGVLVAGYWLARDGRRALSGLVVYGAAAAIATYLTWPVLWGNPLTAITSRLAAVPEFSRHEVLFLGQLYEANDLPWGFLPGLLAIQLTLPAVVLFLVGAPASWVTPISAPKPRLFLALLWVWFLAPAAAVLMGAVPIYNNFRHLLFALPPMFLLMGFGAAVVAARIRSAGWRVALAALALAPGLVGILRLHPYEYIYYNELVGGVRGAYGRFDLDYWCTAFRAAMGVVNRAAEPGDRVASAGGHLTASPFARKDIIVDDIVTDSSDAQFALACRRDVNRATFYPEMVVLDEIKVDGALLAVVKHKAGAP